MNECLSIIGLINMVFTMEAVLNESAKRRTHAADISAEVSTQVTDIHVRNITENRNTNHNSENILNLNGRVLNEGELPVIDQPIIN